MKNTCFQLKKYAMPRQQVVGARLASKQINQII
jgi:hypothetical protein